MPFFFPFHKQEPNLPTVSEKSPIQDQPLTTEEKRKDSATAPSATKLLPTRTPSTRIQEPTRHPSRTKRSASERNVPSNSQRDNTTPERPGMQRRRTTAQTRYISMLLSLDSVPRLHNILASFSTWILLAGYIVFPATFTNLQNDKDLDEAANSALKHKALETVRNAPLLYVAAFACGIGVVGCAWLWWSHRENYVWVINRVFLPALMNSIAGLISTLVNVYSAQDGQYSVTAKATVIVTACCSVVTAALFLLYNTVMLGIVKRRHGKETRAVEREQSQGQNEMNGVEDMSGGRAVGRDVGRVV